MGLLDSYADDNSAALDDLVRRPPAAKPQAAKFSAWSMLTAAPRGIGAGSNETAGGVADMLGAFGQVMGATDSRPSMFSAQTEDQRKQEEDARRKMLDKGLEFDTGDTFRATAREWMPDPATAHTAEGFVFNATRFVTKAVSAVSTLGPAAGAVFVAGDEALTTADDLKRQGVDFATRSKVGAVTGVLSGVGAVLPVAGNGTAQTVGLIAAGGPGSFMAQQAATRQILRDADYSKLADQYDPLDPVGLAVSTLVPAGFGVWAMRGMRGRAAEVKPGETAPEVRPDAAPVQDSAQTEPARPRPTPEQVDAARVEMLTQHVESARLTPPEDVVGARANDEAMARAIEQLARGERVEVSDVAPVPSVSAPLGVEFKSGADGFVSANTDVGTVGGHVRGDALHITFAEVAQESQGKGEGVRLYSALVDKALAEGLRVFSDSTVEAAAVRVYESLKRRGYDVRRLEGGEIDGAAFGKGAKEPAFEIVAGPNRPPDVTPARQAFDAWSSQISKTIADIRSNTTEAAANVQDAPQAATYPFSDRGNVNATEVQAFAAEQAAADARGAAPAGAAEQGGGVPRAGGPTPEAAAVAARLADVSQQFPDLTVQMDGMDSPMRLSDFLDQVRREAMDGTDMDIGGNDAPLMQVAASCFLLNGA